MIFYFFGGGNAKGNQVMTLGLRGIEGEERRKIKVKGKNVNLVYHCCITFLSGHFNSHLDLRNNQQKA